MMRLALLAVALLALSGCSDSETASKPLGAPCGDSSDCESGLGCGFGRCRVSCEDDGACATGVCLGQNGGAGVCALAGDQGCTAGGCADGLVCGADDVCRLSCSDAGECGSGGTCLEGACFEHMPGSEHGWLFYGSTESGRLELYAARDDGSRVVRLTDGLTDDAEQASMVRSPSVSPDGRYVAFNWGRNPVSGEMDNLARVYRMDADGANLSFLVTAEQAGESGMASGVSWMPDARHVVYAQHIPCADSLAKLDAVALGEPETIFNPASWSGEDPAPAVNAPSINPTDADDLLFSNAPCGVGSYTRRGRLKTQQLTEVPAATVTKLPQDPWAPDGTSIVLAESNRLYAIPTDDTTRSDTLYVEQAEGVTLRSATFGNDGRRIYFLRTQDGSVLEVRVYDRATGKTWPLALHDTSLYQNIDWALLPEDPDRDRDGLGNGIDPTPDG